MAKQFNNTMRCIDDLLTLNNSWFDRGIADIYPPELQLKNTTESHNIVVLRYTYYNKQWEMLHYGL